MNAYEHVTENNSVGTLPAQLATGGILTKPEIAQRLRKTTRTIDSWVARGYPASEEFGTNAFAQSNLAIARKMFHATVNAIANPD
jgi:hypothetical protein